MQRQRWTSILLLCLICPASGQYQRCAADQYEVYKKTVISGTYSWCVLTNNNKAKCWGRGQESPYGSYDIIGDGGGEMGDNLPFVNIDKDLTDVCSYVFGGAALTVSGKVYTWGLNNFYGLGYTTASTSQPQLPQQVTQSISGSGRYVTRMWCGKGTNAPLFERSDGTLWTWGNSAYLTGASSHSNLQSPTQVSVTIDSGTTITDVAVSAFTCFILQSDGVIKMFGYMNNVRYKGVSGAVSPSSPVIFAPGNAGYDFPIRLTTMNSGNNFCVQFRSGIAQCYGHDRADDPGSWFPGQTVSGDYLGDASSERAYGNAIDITSGDIIMVGASTSVGATCALVDTNDQGTNNPYGVKCWGYVPGAYAFGWHSSWGSGTSDAGTTTETGDSIPYIQAENAVYVANSRESYCYVDGNLDINCWGRQQEGIMGTGSTGNTRYPTKIDLGTGVTVHPDIHQCIACTPCPVGWAEVFPCDPYGDRVCADLCPDPLQDYSPDDESCHCIAGYYLDSGSCLECPAGQYCPGDDATHSCPLRSSSAAGSDSSDDCVCEAGAMGDGTTCDDCTANYYCGENTASIAEATACPGGTQSPAGSSVATDCSCPAGTYGPRGTGPCAACPTGHFCEDETSTICPEGTYCENGAQNSCYTGQTSPAGSTAASACTCSAGEYVKIITCDTGALYGDRCYEHIASGQTYSEAQATCTSVAGRTMPIFVGSLEESHFIVQQVSGCSDFESQHQDTCKTWLGMYKQGDDTWQWQIGSENVGEVVVPDGVEFRTDAWPAAYIQKRYSAEPYDWMRDPDFMTLHVVCTESTQCVACVDGEWCDGSTVGVSSGSCSACPLGTYVSSPCNASHDTVCSECSADHWCAGGMMTACPEAHGAYPGAISADNCSCPFWSASPVELEDPPLESRTITPIVLTSSMYTDSRMDAVSYGNVGWVTSGQPGILEVDMGREVEFYCVRSAGRHDANQYVKDATFKVKLDGATEWTHVTDTGIAPDPDDSLTHYPLNTQNNPFTDTMFSSAWRGRYITVSTWTSGWWGLRIGFYVSEGITCTACPEGSCCNGNAHEHSACIAPGHISSMPCEQCQCDASYVGANGFNCSICPEGFWCPPGTQGTQNACPATLSSEEGSTTADMCACPGGTLPDGDACSTCPAGSYCPQNATDPTPCPAGMTSAPGSTGRPDCGCEAGTFEEPGDTCATCPLNHFCAQGANATACPSNRVSPEGSDAPDNCSCITGFHAELDSGSPSTDPATACVACPEHHYCPDELTLTPCKTGAVAPALSTAAANCSCVEGQATNGDNTACEACTGNTYRPAQDAPDACLQCTNGDATPDKTDCLCRAGFYFDSTACSPCPGGST